MNDQDKEPKLIAFEVTRRCRYACSHCRAGSSSDGQAELKTAQCKKILKAIADYAKSTVSLTGGEPMERDDIYKLIEYGTDLKLNMVMATCGYLIDDDSLQRLKTAGIRALSFNIDGASSESHDSFRQTPGAFDAVIRAAEKAKKADIPFQVSTTISRINADEAVGIAELAKRLGADTFNPFIHVPRSEKNHSIKPVLDPIEYEALLNELLEMKLETNIKICLTCDPAFASVCAKKRINQLSDDVSGCMGGRGFAFISNIGNVQTCGSLEISAGNIIENGYNFTKIWSESQFLSEIRDTSRYTGDCGDCEHVGICGGCRARAFAASGSYLHEDPLCPHRKKA
jgi:radical SAM protein with 4Fe4S-binding SPASM domain